MKRWNLILCLLAICAYMYAQDSTISNGYKVFYYPSGVKSSEGTLVNGQPDGWWKSYDENGNLVSEGNRKNLLLDSLWTFYNDGKKYLTQHYVAGKKEGEEIRYTSTDYTVTHWQADSIIDVVSTFDNAGWLKRSIPYAAGKAHGMAKEYNSDGLVVKVTKYYRGIMGRSERINRTDKSGLKQGNWKYFWENGNLKMEASYLNDKKHGFFKYYDENGNFLYVEKYTNDLLDDEAKETKQLDRRVAYHPNGQPSIIATYHKDKPEGIRREFDTEGKIIKGYVFKDGWLRYEGITDMNGLRQGLWKEYYQTGELLSKGKYKNSVPVGEWKFYFQDKSLEIIGDYDQKGRKVGEWIWFYPSGDTMVVAHYEDGELDGDYVEYDEQGIPLVKGEYVAGLEEGLWTYRNGDSREYGKYDGGKQTGLWTTTFDNDKPAYKIHYEEGIREGKYVAYWENGNVKVTGKYEKGLQEGTWIQYNEEGVQYLTTLFKEGKELKWNNYTIK